MAGANSNIQVTDLDFNTIKNNLKTFLQSQSVLQDYNYEGSALSVILDLLAYNTQYNAYYLNMVANEMFLDTALARSSVVSHAKLLNYIPKSALAPTATINLTVNQITDSSLTLPKFTNFLSEAVDGVNYNFVTTDSYTVGVTNGSAVFNNVPISQGIPSTIGFAIDNTNSNSVFQIPNAGIDTTTLLVTVQKSSTDSTYTVYTPATNFLELENDSTVYFLQEGLTGLYEIYFGDGILGKQLSDGNIVNVSYIVTNGTLSSGANNFSIMDSVGGYANTSITSVSAASTGGAKESIDSIKFQAPKAYASQGRAVTKDDYITLIQQNTLGYSFDAVNVWGGEQNDPPVYGQIFVCLKPAGAYQLSEIQKQKLIRDVIKPVSVMTVQPTIIEPDYTYIKLNVNVLYDSKKTAYTSGQISQLVTNAINNFSTSTLNTFNSTFSAPVLTTAIQNADASIITNEVNVQFQKKFHPDLNISQTYKLYYTVPIKKGMFQSGINSDPGMQFQDTTNAASVIDGVYIEEIPSSTGGLSSVSILNPGYNYITAPTVTILGDGTGATAIATISSSGSILSITVTNAGSGYTSAIVTITPASSDSSGQGGAAVAILEGQYGTLRTYYNDATNTKTILNGNIGTIDYVNGIVTLNSFAPAGVDNDLGQLAVTINPTTTIVSSSYNRIITIDPYDPTAITVNVTAK